MRYDPWSTFSGGLEAKIGPPNPKVREAMEGEHTKARDSLNEFTASNYGTTTTPQAEWWFIAEPGREGVEWPVEKELCGTAESRGKMRKPMSLAVLQTQLDQVNARLKNMEETELMIEEAFGARLFTGPMCGTSASTTRTCMHMLPQHICSRDLHTATSHHHQLAICKPQPHHMHTTTYTPPPTHHHHRTTSTTPPHPLHTTTSPPKHQHLTTYTPAPPQYSHRHITTTTTYTPQPRHLHTTTSPPTHHITNYTHHLTTITSPPTHHHPNLTLHKP